MVSVPPEFTEVFWETWATMLAFRRLGFAKEDLYFVYNNHHSFVQVMLYDARPPEGPPDFTADCGHIPRRPYDVVRQAWEQFAEAGNQLSAEESDARWRASWIARNSVSFLLALQRKGVRIRREPSDGVM